MDERAMEAEKLYVSGDMTLKDLGEQTGISLVTLKKWSKKEGWAQKRRDFQRKALEKATKSALKKRAKELEKLLDAAVTFDEALYLAVNGMVAQRKKDKTGNRIANGRFQAANVSHIANALGRQAETRMLLAGLMPKAEQEKIQLLKRKQALEERKAEKEQEAGGARITLLPQVEELLDADMEDLIHADAGNAGAEQQAEAVLRE